MSNIDDQSKDLVSILQRALFYETQYRNAMVSDAMSFYDVNLTRNVIESEVFYKDSDGNFRSTLEIVGISAPCKFSDFIEKWVSKVVPANLLPKYPFLFNVRENLIETFNQGKREYFAEYWMERLNGERLFIRQRFLLTQNEKGEICALSVVKDGTTYQLASEENRRKELEQYAYYDPLTHGYNYIKFKEKLKTVNIPGTIISLDIHSFKIINTLSGIAQGDRVIEAIWKAITVAMDFDEGDMAGHINADHFAIFLPTFDKEIIKQKLHNLTLGLSMISSELGVPQVAPYYGIARWSPDRKIELSYSEAVAAKTNAKNLVNINYAFFDENDTIRKIREKIIIDGFEDALAKKEFKIWYQPKYNPLSRELVGAEALVRWQITDGTVISPGEFIPLFERNGMIRQFDEYVFRNVCEQQNVWEVEGKEIVPVSINLSRVSLYYTKIVDEYKRISEEIGIDKNYLPIEITESAAVTNNEIKKIADKFYAAGFSLHMDDFGSGYSSLATLNLMHFDTLKLDKSLIDYIGNFGGDRLLEHTILLAKELGMHVTAEGVETEKQVSFLKHVGCDSIQGYYYSKPITSEQFSLLLGNKTNLVEDNTDYDFLSAQINDFKNKFFRPPLYTFTVNLTKNTYMEFTGTCDWKEETMISSEKYDESVAKLAKNYITQEFKQAYLDFMDPVKIRERLGDKKDITEFFSYQRNYNQQIHSMRIMSHVFMSPDKADLWMYMTVSLLD